MAERKNTASLLKGRPRKKAKISISPSTKLPCYKESDWTILALPVVKPVDEKELLHLEADLAKMGLQTLLFLPWNFCHSRMTAELKCDDTEVGPIRANPDTWSVEFFAAVYGLDEFLDGAVEFRAVKDSCLYEHLTPTMGYCGYQPSSLKHPRLGPLLRFLAPILSPSNPFTMSKKMAATVVDCWHGKYRVNWAAFIHNAVLMAVEKLVPASVSARPCYVSAFIAHLYAHEKVLTGDEQIEYDSAEGVWIAGCEELVSEVPVAFRGDEDEDSDAVEEIDAKPASSVSFRVMQRFTRRTKPKPEPAVVLAETGQEIVSSLATAASAISVTTASITEYLAMVNQVATERVAAITRIPDLECQVEKLGLEIARLQARNHELQAQAALRSSKIEEFEQAVVRLQSFQALDQLSTYKAALFDSSQEKVSDDEKIFGVATKLSRTSAHFLSRIRDAGVVLRDSLQVAKDLGFQFSLKVHPVEASGMSGSGTTEVFNKDLAVSSSPHLSQKPSAQERT